MKLTFIIGGIVLLILTLGFNAMFNLAFLDKLCVESVVSQYKIIGKDLQRTIQKSICLGKNIKKFIGIEKILKKNINKLKNISSNFLSESSISVSIALTDGSILYSSCEELINTRFPQQKKWIKKKGDKKVDLIESTYIKNNNIYTITLPIYDLNKELIATIIIAFDEKDIKANLNYLISKNIKLIILVLSSAILFIIIFFVISTSKLNLQILPKGKISFFLLSVVTSSLIIFFGSNTISFREYYLKLNKKSMEITTASLKEDIELYLSKGIRLERISKLDILLNEIIIAFPELDNISILNKDKKPLYTATQPEATDFRNAHSQNITSYIFPNKPSYSVLLNISENDQIVGYISAEISKTILSEKILKITLDFLTVIVISIIFSVELLILFFKIVERQIKIADPYEENSYGFMRTAAFLFLFGIDISISFLPLHMEKLYEPILGFSKDMVIGLPISVEFFFVGISMLIAGAWLDRRGWHEPFLIGLFLASMGAIYSWIAPSALHFIVSRGVVGFGYGLSLMASQGFVIIYSDEKSKARALAHLFAGIYAGSICGTATGAMLAERIGYHLVFIGGAVILFSVIVYTFVFMRNAIKKPIYYDYADKDTLISTSDKYRNFYNFLTNKSVLSLIFLSSLPTSIAIVGFLNYFSPIYLNRIGASQSTIGRVLMAYGICLVYFGPYISKYVDASKTKQTYIFLGCTLGSLAFLIFYVFDGLIAAVLAVLLLGLSNSFVLASQTTYALKLKVTQELGEGKAIGIFRSTSRIGQALGPVIFSWMIIKTNINQGITYLGLLYLFSALLFFLLTKRDQRIALVENV